MLSRDRASDYSDSLNIVATGALLLTGRPVATGS
jgi:hypothetical protein